MAIDGSSTGEVGPWWCLAGISPVNMPVAEIGGTEVIGLIASHELPDFLGGEVFERAGAIWNQSKLAAAAMPAPHVGVMKEAEDRLAAPVP